MVAHMKTTLNIPEPVMGQLRIEARRRGVTMSELVEVALRQLLHRRSEPLDEPPALPRWDSGGLLVDVADRDALHRALDGD